MLIVVAVAMRFQEVRPSLHQNFNQFLLETTQFEDTVLPDLTAQHENYVNLIIILLTVPLALYSTFGFIAPRGINNNVYVLVTLVLLIGCFSKNTMLIVEFANQLRETELTITQAAQTAAEKQFCSILITEPCQLKCCYGLCQN